MGINYGEIICEAVETIGESLLQGLKFDSTIKCTITDASEADKGIYQVSNGSATFTAYSSEKYKVNTNVYVVIPQSDYDNEKIIVGKVAKKDEMLYNYVAPLDNMMAIKNDIVSENVSAGLIANHPEKLEVELFTWSTNDNNQSLSGFTRLGVSAEFLAWLLNYNCISGDYGLKLDIAFESPETPTSSLIVTTHRTLFLSVADMIGNPYAFETFYSQEKMFDISDLGNIVGITGSFYLTASSFKQEDGNPLPYLYKGLNEQLIDLPDNLFIRNIELSIGFDVRDQEGEFVLLYSFNGNAYSNNNAELITNLRWLHVYSDGNKAPIEPADLNAKDEQDKDAYKFPTNVEIRWYRYELGNASDGYGGVNWQCVEVETRQSVNTDQTLPGEVQPEIQTNYDFIFKFTPNNLRYQELIKAVILWNCVYKTENNITTRESVESIYRSNIFTYYNITDGYRDSIITQVGGTITSTKDEIDKAIIDAKEKLEGQIGLLEIDFNTSLATEQIERVKEIYKNALKQSFIDLWLNTPYYELICEDLVNGTNQYKESFGNYLLYDELNNLIDLAQKKILRKISIIAKSDDWSTDIIATTQWSPVSSPKPGSETGETIPEYGMLKNISANTTAKPKSDYTYTIASHLDSLHSNTQVVCTITTQADKINYPPYEITEDNKIIWDYPVPVPELSGEVVSLKDECYPAMTTSVVQQLTFGLAGTLGATCTLVLDFDGDDIAFNAPSNILLIQSKAVTLHVYDENNRKVDLSNDSDFTVEWDWYIKSSTSSLIVDIDQTGFTNTITTSNAIVLSINDIYILKATLKGWKNSGSETEYDLTAFLPIPIRSSSSYSHISGADKIVYLSDGTPKCYMGAYELYLTLDDELTTVEEVTWQTNLPSIASATDAQKESIYNLPSIKEVKKTNDDNTTTVIGYKLLPAPFYDNDAITNMPFAVLAKVGNTVVWTQPILIIQNKYFSSVINQWDGKTVLIDTDNGEVLASRIGAGRKNSSNQFSGVILGDWRNSNLGYTGTGLFGFREGQVSFGLQDDGTAFIGGAGGSLLRFDGNNGVITSSGYLNNNTTGSVIQTDGTGLYLDFDDALIKLTDESPETTGENGHTRTKHSIILDAKAINYPLQIGDKFKVKWDGTVEAKNGSFKGSIEATGTDNKITGTLNVNGTLNITGEGIITAENGTIGGWIIQQNYLQSSDLNTTLYGASGISANVYNINDSLGKFGIITSAANDTLIGLLYGTEENSSVILRNNVNWIGANGSKVAMLLGQDGAIWITNDYNKEAHINIASGGEIIVDENGLRFNGTIYGKDNPNDVKKDGSVGQIYFQVVGS